MVRIVSQNFSPQRSRHSSGETDKYLAERASSALGLAVLGKKRFDLPECESSSDSFWDSELDVDHLDAVNSEQGEDNNDINGNETLKKSAVLTKRKERRRERNKLSAQAYRQRRRSQNMKEQQQLSELEAENRRLHKLVDTLEKKTEQTKQFLLGCSVPMPDVLFSSSSATTEATACAAAASPSPESLDHHHPHHPDHHHLHHHHLSTNSSATSAHSTPSRSEEPESPSPIQTVFQSSPLMAVPSGPSTPLISNGNVGDVLHKGSVAACNANNTDSAASAGGAPSPSHAEIKPAPHTQILLNANALMQSPLQVQATSLTNMPTFTVPTLMAIPVEYSHAATNYNSNSHLLQSKKSLAAAAGPITTATVAGEERKPAAAPVVGAIMWSINGNPQPGAGAVYSLMNLEMCNNNNNNNNINMNNNVVGRNLNSPLARKSYNGCDNTNPGATAPGSPVTVNLNEVKIPAESLQIWQAQRNFSHGMH